MKNNPFTSIIDFFSTNLCFQLSSALFSCYAGVGRQKYKMNELVSDGI